jgi:hypothetical protein
MSARYSCQIFIKPQISQQIFERYEISLKSVQRELSFSMRTDGHDESNSLSS